MDETNGLIRATYDNASFSYKYNDTNETFSMSGTAELVTNASLNKMIFTDPVINGKAYYNVYMEGPGDSDEITKATYGGVDLDLSVLNEEGF